MATYTVEVGSIASRAVTTKFGSSTVYDMVTTDGRKVSYGFKNPSLLGITTGSKITFEGTEDKYGIKVVKDTVRMASASDTATPAPVDAPRPSAGFSGGSKGSFPISKSDGQIAIIRQNSLTNAVNMLSGMLKAGYPLVPAGTEDTAGYLADQAINLAYKFTEFSSGGREVAAVERMRAAASGTSDDLSRALTAASKGNTG